MNLLSLLIFLPLFGAALILFLPASQTKYFKWITLGFCAVELLAAAVVYHYFDLSNPSFQFVEQTDWITLSLGSLGAVSIDYLLGIDGISLPLVLLTGVVMLVGAVSSWQINSRQRAYFSLYLLLTASIMGCFLALDFFLFFLFFEFMLLPMYFLIGLWGGPRREYAAIKFFLYTLLGSVLILVVMIALYLSAFDPYSSLNAQTIVHTFDLRYLADGHNYLPDSLLNGLSAHKIMGFDARLFLFLVLFAGFAIKLPVVPFHTWLPDAHVEAPTPVSVVLAGVLLKIGGYGFIRIAYTIFPDAAAEYATLLGVLGMISIVYGGFNALAQSDLKKMIAYSSVSHMGFVLLGVASLTPEGLNGAVYQMVSHGVLSAMLFVVTGVLYDRTQNRQIEAYRGLAKPMPAYTTLTAICFFASLGLPGFSGFIGELFTLMGGFQSEFMPKWIAAASTLGIVLAAAYFLWTLQRMFFGPLWTQKGVESLLADLTPREKIMLLPLATLTLVLGLFPHLIFDITSATITEFLKKFSLN